MNAYEGRRCRLRARVLEVARALLVTDPYNVRYLSGFVESLPEEAAAALIVDEEETFLVTDSRYHLQACEQAPDCSLEITSHLLQGIAAVVRRQGIVALAYEETHLTCGRRADLAEHLPQTDLIPTRDLVASLRMCKEPAELQAIAAAAALTDAAFAHLCGLLRPGMSEHILALEAEFFMRRQGAERIAFPPIIAAGPRGALPHASPSERPLHRGDLVVVDMGAVVDGYCADLTRTVAVGEASEQAREIYRICHQAQAAGLEALAPGRPGAQVDAAARQVIAQAGYGERFGHGLGHSLGLQPHEPPRLSPGETRSLSPGMVITVEPGIYLPDVGGARIEDLVEITAEGSRLLSHAPKPPELPIV